MKTLASMIAVLLAVVAAGGASALRTQNPFDLSQVRGPVKLNGLGDEPAWQGFPPFVVGQHQPPFGEAPSGPTEILVAYDDDGLYVAGRLFDADPDRIRAHSKLRDSWGANEGR